MAKIKEFQDVRDWKAIRGIGGDVDVSHFSEDKLKTFMLAQMQYQRFLQEGVEIHDALVKDDEDEFQDAVGDTIVTLINIANIKGYDAERCLEKAFDVIRLRKGLTSDHGDFVRYGKLSDEDKAVCDLRQGNPKNQYFLESKLEVLEPKDFRK